MKRWMAIVLAALMLMGAALAEESDRTLETSLELAACVGELVGDDAFRGLMSSSQQFDELLEPLQRVDYGAPLSAWRLEKTPLFDVVAQLAGAFDVDFSALSNAGQERFEQMLPQSLLTQANGNRGADWLALAAMLTFSRTYVMPEDFAPCIDLIEFDGAIVSVSFAQTGEETITATAMLVANGAEDIESFAREVAPALMYTVEQVA